MSLLYRRYHPFSVGRKSCSFALLCLASCGFAVGLLALLGTLPAQAQSSQDITITVQDPGGAGFAQAILMLEPLDVAAAATPAAAGDTAKNTAKDTAKDIVVDQHFSQFTPYVSYGQVGDKLRFRNSDGYNHHVYSFSPAQTFNINIGPGLETDPLTLDKPGVVAIGCNIHDAMLSYLFIAAAGTEIFESDMAGQWQGQLAPGRYRLSVWHPQINQAAAPLVQEFMVDAADSATKAAVLLVTSPRGIDLREQLRQKRRDPPASSNPYNLYKSGG